MTTAVAHETREEPRRTDAVTALSIEGRRRADNPARGGGGRPIVRRGAQNEAERVAGGGREREPSGRHLIDVAWTHFADHHADGAAAQRFFHGPQHVALARGGNRDQPLGSNPDPVETGPMRRAIFGKREILGDPEHVSSRSDRNRPLVVARARIARIADRGRRSPPRCPSRRERQREAAGGGGFRLARGGDLVQRAGAEPAAESAVDDGVTERERSAAIPGEAGCRLERAELPTQPVDAGCRLPAGRSVQSCGGGHGAHVHDLFY